MLVGLKGYWKLPVGYFLFVEQNILFKLDLSGMALRARVVIWTVTMDVTQHNISIFNDLGANLKPSHLCEIKKCMSLPSCQSSCEYNFGPTSHDKTCKIDPS
ncbi:unnamed protein product [Lepeophtheirus salmonis]|uniref:(salmon louse) hypothetical protein n=1 Tax=Lepeophtheirus salmonis TaxID=72036 RepID=A0A7R8H3K5_LEPSM|nr:unnamed protein product [Lepeophtheirus salmonis]CAF2843990.1 unnamed protein product [Lepeophtheirus salmonis]